MSKSQYSNTENIETEIQLADSGYGQGQMLINPLHMACIYTAFCNQGNVVKPYFIQKQEMEYRFSLLRVRGRTQSIGLYIACAKRMNR